MKYIIVEDGNLEKAIVFDTLLNHKDVARGFHKVISAGFCRIIYKMSIRGGVEVWGESVTLDMESRKEDAELIKCVIFGED